VVSRGAPIAVVARPGLGLALGLALTLALGCAGRPVGRGHGDGNAPADARITLYRDSALVEEVHRVAVDRAGVAIIPLAGDVLATAELQVGSPDVDVLEWSRVPSGTTGAEVEVRTSAGDVRGRALGETTDGTQLVAADDGVHLVTGAVVAGGRAASLRVVVAGAPTHATIELRYPSEHLRWHVAYTLIADRGDRGRLHGALALDNQTGRVWQRARFAIVDRDRPIAIPSGLPDERFVVRVRGRFAVTGGEQRLDLGLPARAIPLQPTLVYDPVGTSLDSAAQMPLGDPEYGVAKWPARVVESVVLDVSALSREPLPAGAVRMFAIGADGSLAWRGEGTLLPPADDVELRTAIAIGEADGVTGQRTRTMFERDDANRRLVEEITLRFDNQRQHAVELLAREHLYRGICWTLAYHSTGPRVAKEGEQQVGLGVTVPARATATIVYRVVYQWDSGQCKLSKSAP